MIESKLLVGRFVRFPLTRPSLQYQNGSFLDQPPIQLKIEESTGLFTKTSAVSQGHGAKAHRNYTWLGWYPGAVSMVTLGGADVLSGPMSGCWLVVFRRNGMVRVGHVGTFERRDSEQSVAARLAWNNFAQQNPGAVICGFNPSASWNRALPERLPTDSPGRVLGVVTTSYALFSVFVYPQTTDAGKFRIAGVEQCSTAGLNTLSNL